MEYIFVHFDENDIRDVLVNGGKLGTTEDTLMLKAGYCEITLSGTGYEPPKWMGDVATTTPADPQTIVFTRAVPHQVPPNNDAGIGKNKKRPGTADV